LVQLFHGDFTKLLVGSESLMSLCTWNFGGNRPSYISKKETKHETKKNNWFWRAV